MSIEVRRSLCGACRRSCTRCGDPHDSDRRRRNLRSRSPTSKRIRFCLFPKPLITSLRIQWPSRERDDTARLRSDRMDLGRQFINSTLRAPLSTVRAACCYYIPSHRLVLARRSGRGTSRHWCVQQADRRAQRARRVHNRLPVPAGRFGDLFRGMSLGLPAVA